MMQPMSAEPSLLIEPGATLLHIGAPKTGSTALQHAASTLRPELAEAGVLYPGRTLHHQKGTSHLIGRQAKAWPGGHAKAEWWDALEAEIRASSARKLVSFEVICEADIDKVRVVQERMPGPVHVVMVLRNFGDLLPSMWQQKVKAGLQVTLDEWLVEALADESAVHILGSDAFHRSDGRSLPHRWAEVFGAENVTVVVLDRARPEQLFGSFEGMLGLPEGLLAQAPSTGHSANRGMSALEAAVALEVNRRTAERGVKRREHRTSIWKGPYDRMLAERMPGRTEGRLGLPAWAVEPCRRAGAILASEIDRSGVRVVGDLGALSAAVEPAREDQLALPDALPTDLAMELVLGAVSAGLGRGPDFSPPSRRRPAKPDSPVSTARPVEPPVRRGLLRRTGAARRRPTT